MYRNRRKLITRISVVVLLISIVAYGINYFASTRTVEISTKNTALFSVNEEGSNTVGEDTPATTKSVRIKKDKTYAVTYKGVSGYGNGTIVITPTTTTVTINPDYSYEKLTQMLDAEIGTINAVIAASGTNITTRYTIERGQLSHFGDWYFTTLKYNGSSDDDSSDTLVVGLQKKAGKWVTVLFPDIVFTTTAYPDVDRDFINAGNAYHDTYVTPVE